MVAKQSITPITSQLIKLIAKQCNYLPIITVNDSQSKLKLAHQANQEPIKNNNQITAINSNYQPWHLINLKLRAEQLRHASA